MLRLVVAARGAVAALATSALTRPAFRASSAASRRPSATASMRSWSPAAVGSRHGQVEAGGDRGDPVGDRAPVGHDDALVSPLVAQQLGEQPVILAGVHAVDLVVGAHHGPRPRPRDHPVEGAQVHLTQGSLVDVCADPQPVGLLVVDREVLDRRADVPALQSVHPLGRQHAGQQRVLGEVLEVPAAQGAALEVDARAEQYRDAHGAALIAEGLPHPAQQSRVPGGGAGHGGREAGGRLPPEHVPRVRLQAHPVRPVGDGDRSHARGLDSRGVPRIVSAGEGRLLGDGELRRHSQVPSALTFFTT